MSNKRINVTRQEFQKSYYDHYNLYKRAMIESKTRRLVLFYSVECGLKSLLLKRIGKHNYNELESYCEINQKNDLKGHDIKAMLKELNIGDQFKLKKLQLINKGGSVYPKKYNELWRYGAAVDCLDDEKKEEKTLVKIAEWIETVI